MEGKVKVGRWRFVLDQYRRYHENVDMIKWNTLIHKPADNWALHNCHIKFAGNIEMCEGFIEDFLSALVQYLPMTTV